MAAVNNKPIYSKVGVIGPNATMVVGSTANVKNDGTGTIGTDIFKLFTADSTNGSWVSRIRFVLTITGALTASAATVLRVYVSNKTSGATTAADTWCFQEVAAPAQTPTTTTAMNFIEIPLGFALPASWTILGSSHIINTANTAWIGFVLGGNY